jgi:hypothetical protein
MRGEVVGISVGIMPDGQNLNFAVSSKHLVPFVRYAATQPPQNPRAALSGRGNAIPRQITDPEEDDVALVFVDEDDSYEIYIERASVQYSDDDSIVSIWSVWFPSERAKAAVVKTFGLTKMPLSIFALHYLIDTETDEGSHRRTVNFYNDGSIARDYTVPNPKWYSSRDNKRIRAFISALRKIDL